MDIYDKLYSLSLWNPKHHRHENIAPSLPQCLCWGLSCSWSPLQTSAEISAALDVCCRPEQRSMPLENLTLLIVNLVASWMDLYNCRCFQEHLRMLLQSLRAHCKVPGGHGSISKYLQAQVRATRVTERFACVFLTDLHFADVIWWTRCSKLAAKDFVTSEFYQDTRNCYLMSRFVMAYIPWNATANPELLWWYIALQSELVLLSATTLSIICRREYSPTLHAIMKQSPSSNEVSVALDG